MEMRYRVAFCRVKFLRFRCRQQPKLRGKVYYFSMIDVVMMVGGEVSAGEKANSVQKGTDVEVGQA